MCTWEKTWLDIGYDCIVHWTYSVNKFMPHIRDMKGAQRLREQHRLREKNASFGVLSLPNATMNAMCMRNWS